MMVGRKQPHLALAAQPELSRKNPLYQQQQQSVRNFVENTQGLVRKMRQASRY